MGEYDPGKLDWQTQDSGMASVIEHWRRWEIPVAAFQASHALSVSVHDSIQAADEAQPTVVSPHPDVLVQAAVVLFGDQTAEGQIIAGLKVPWFEIIAQLDRDPDFLFKIPWRKLEEIVAGAYERAGWPEVVLTPRSGDDGRDVIATRPGVGSIRIVDQIKAYRPGNLVTADEIRSMLGVLDAERNVSKGFVTTTSRFAPGIKDNERLRAFMPYRLELKDGDELRAWLLELAKK
jgi:restriction system protein